MSIRTYQTQSCISFVILSRTAKTVIKVNVHGKPTIRRISMRDEVESFQPFGNYAPTIRADKAAS
jgi:hypothetical protein